MLDRDTRAAILALSGKGHGIRAIARTVGVDRRSVREVLSNGRADVPTLRRPEQGTPYLERIQTLYTACEGNLVRVQEELQAEGVSIRYSTLTSFCRRHGIGVVPKKPTGQYHFEPGEEMQHDTSPHNVKVGGSVRLLQCASLVLAHSRMLYAQVYPTFTRFRCKVFLTDALRYFGGSALRCVVDNSHVILVSGTGRNAIFAPEMEAFGTRFGFHFFAHEKGDANRSARVERPFHYIENNFYVGRTFADLPDLNRQLITWCDGANGRRKDTIRTTPLTLFATERHALQPLPAYIPEVYTLHERIVDTEGYVGLHANRDSVPTTLLGRRVEVREYKDRVHVFDGHRLVAEHDAAEPGAHLRTTLEAHRDATRWRHMLSAPPPLPEETRLRSAAPDLIPLIDALDRSQGIRFSRALRHLHRLWIDYPAEPLFAAVREALEHGLADVDRIEKMVLRNIAGDFFRIPTPRKPHPKDDQDE
jgi:transposase